MPNPQLVKSYDAEGAIAAYRFAKTGSAEGTVVQATAAAATIKGITQLVTAKAAGDRVDLVMAGIAEIEYGAAVSDGDPLTSDADGKAVPATTGQPVFAKALVDGVAGDIVDTFIAPSTLP
ncbi:hypothetical protein [Emcibacter sp.]|uniref:hypothetical protein n=1 Tax=Emcibacter sp. TaxID=1979954 RepID=UPI002AA6744D|nr:hypothetical protein [Emcibacter sp.]